MHPSSLQGCVRVIGLNSKHISVAIKEAPHCIQNLSLSFLWRRGNRWLCHGRRDSKGKRKDVCDREMGRSSILTRGHAWHSMMISNISEIEEIINDRSQALTCLTRSLFDRRFRAKVRIAKDVEKKKHTINRGQKC